MTPFALHIWGETSVRSVHERIEHGDDPNEVLNDFNESPTAILVNYITHLHSLGRKCEIMEMAETFFQDGKTIFIGCVRGIL